MFDCWFLGKKIDYFFKCYFYRFCGFGIIVFDDIGDDKIWIDCVDGNVKSFNIKSSWFCYIDYGVFGCCIGREYGFIDFFFCRWYINDLVLFVCDYVF